mgnify:CR=1 FL=1
MAQLTCQALSVGYNSGAVLKDISFCVNKGDYLCILGENGSGKSTLMKTLLGLLPPLGGKIQTGDGLKPRQIGYLPQQTDVQKDFPASVREIVLSGCQGRCGKRPFYNKEEKQLADDSMLILRSFHRGVTANCPEVSSRGFFSPVRCVRRRRCCCLTSRYPDLTPPLPQICIGSLLGSTEKMA